MSAWGPYGSCSSNGTRTRSRTILTNALNGGNACPALTETDSEPCANDPQCSFIKSDADLRSATNIKDSNTIDPLTNVVINERIKDGCCGGKCDCSISYVKCGKTPGGHYIRTDGYDYIVKNGRQAYVNNGVENLRSTMKLRNGQNIFGPCGNCGGYVGKDIEMDKSSLEKSVYDGARCTNCKGTGKGDLCSNSFMAVDSTGATPPPTAKTPNTGGGPFGMCV